VETKWSPGDTLAEINIEGATHIIKVETIPTGFRLRQRGFDVKAQVLSRRVARLAAMMPAKKPPDTSNLLLCPMPGLIVAISVSVGDQVQEGQILAIVEAMKMENVLRAEKAGKIARIATQAGESLAVDDVIMEFEK
jgi:propionyl-CoA carboxylase alpha chain